MNSQFLRRYLLIDNPAVTHFIDISIHQAGDQSLTKSEAGINGYHFPMRSDGIGSKQNSCRLREDHLLNNHRQVDFTVVEAVLKAVSYCPLGKERCPALADVLQDRLLSDNVQIRILLSCKGCRWQILRRSTGTHSIGIFIT